jgi:hypothetical protein
LRHVAEQKRSEYASRAIVWKIPKKRQDEKQYEDSQSVRNDVFDREQ